MSCLQSNERDKNIVTNPQPARKTAAHLQHTPSWSSLRVERMAGHVCSQVNNKVTRCPIQGHVDPGRGALQTLPQPGKVEEAMPS